MDIRSASEYDIDLSRRVCLIMQVITGVLGVFLLMGTLLKGVHAVLAILLVAMLLLVHNGWEKRWCRVVARIIASLPLAVVALFVADFVLCLVQGAALLASLEMACIILGLVLSYFCLGTAYISLKEGRYDRVIACIYSTLLVVLAAVATFQSAIRYDIYWSWDNNIVRYVWLGSTVAAAVMVWLCAIQRTPAQQAAALEAKEAKKAEKAAKKART